jgi:hypothetical protein
MNPTLFAIVLASAAAAPAPPDAPVKPPEGPPPVQVVASMTRDGEFEITQPALVPATETRERTVNIAGREVKETYPVTVYKTVQVTRRIKGEGVKVYTAAGKEVDAKDVPDKLKKQTIVLFSADGNKVDPFYLKIIKPDTLVIVAPPPAPATTAPPAPSSPPVKPREGKGE